MAFSSLMFTSKAARARRADERRSLMAYAETRGRLEALIIMVERSAKTLPRGCAYHDYDGTDRAKLESACDPCRAATARVSLLAACRAAEDETS